MTNVDVLLGPMQRVTHVEMNNAVKNLKMEKVVGSSLLNAEMIIARGKIGVEIVMELHQYVLHGKGIPDEW